MRPGVGGAPEPAVGGGRDAPLLCLIDGARWLDRPSEKALAFASAVFSRGRSPWCSQPASRSRSSEEELNRYDVRGLKNPRGYPGAALTCRVCGRMIVADEALRIDVALELSQSDCLSPTGYGTIEARMGPVRLAGKTQRRQTAARLRTSDSDDG